MQWNSVSEFLDMGGYALYVWSSFGLTAAVVIIEIWQARQQRQRVLDGLRGQFESEKASS